MIMPASAFSRPTRPKQDPVDENQYLEQKPDVEELITGHMELVRQIVAHAWPGASIN